MGVVPELSERDYTAIRKFRSIGYLTDTSETRGPTVLVGCGDGHRTHESIAFTRRRCLLPFYDHDKCHHLIKKNGGPLVIPRNSILSVGLWRGEEIRHDLACLEDIRDACLIKKAESIILKSHIPCGKALQFTLTVEDVISLHAQAADRVRDEVVLPLCGKRSLPIRILCWLHVDYYGWDHPNGRFRSYELSDSCLARFCRE